LSESKPKLASWQTESSRYQPRPTQLGSTRGARWHLDAWQDFCRPCYAQFDSTLGQIGV